MTEKLTDEHLRTEHGLSQSDRTQILGAAPLPGQLNDVFGALRQNPLLASLLSDAEQNWDLDKVERYTGVAPELVLAAYEQGQFPMADSKDATRLSWIEPSERGIIRLNGFKVPKRLKRWVKNCDLRVTCNLAFDHIVEGCGSDKNGREDTWINPQIRVLYGALHRMGFAHSIEVWDKDGHLVGGLYGIAIQGAFFGESMFSTATNASKLALIHLAARLKNSGITLLDCQFYTRHLSQFGAYEMPEENYLNMLADALIDLNAHFQPDLLTGQFEDFLATV